MQPNSGHSPPELAAAPAGYEADEIAHEPSTNDDPWRLQLAARELAPSGLARGSKLVAFDTIDAQSGEVSCHLCRDEGVAKIIAVGSADDEAFIEDLRDLDAIAYKYREALAVVAILTEFEDGFARSPADPEAARSQADALARSLRSNIPIVVPAPVDPDANDIWREYYNITASRTIMFADGRDQIRYAALAPEDFFGLNVAIRELLAEARG